MLRARHRGYVHIEINNHRRIHAIQEVVDRVWADHVDFIRGARRRWLQGDQQCAADTIESGYDGWDAPIYRGDDSRWTECLAIDRRSGNRHDLGAWSLCRSRLERRLSSSAI